MASWESIGGALTSAPAVCSPEQGQLVVFGRGTDNALWYRWRRGRDWDEWKSLGGGLTSSPAAASWGPNRVDVFVRGEDDALWHKWFDGDWSDWESLGGLLNFGPAVASWGKRRLDVFARGRDNGLWHKWFDGDWSDWTSIADEATASVRPGIAAAASREGRIDLLTFGPNDWLMHKWYDEGVGWHEYVQTVGDSFGPETLTTSIALAAWKADRFELLLRNRDRTLYHWEAIVGDTGHLGYLAAPRSHGGILTSGPAATAIHAGNWVEVFVRGTDNAYWHTAVHSPR